MLELCGGNSFWGKVDVPRHILVSPVIGCCLFLQPHPLSLLTLNFDDTVVLNGFFPPNHPFTISVTG